MQQAALLGLAHPWGLEPEVSLLLQQQVAMRRRRRATAAADADEAPNSNPPESGEGSGACNRDRAASAVLYVLERKLVGRAALDLLARLRQRVATR